MDAEDIAFPATEDWNSHLICSLSAFPGTMWEARAIFCESEDGETSGKLDEQQNKNKKSGKLFLTLIDKA